MGKVIIKGTAEEDLTEEEYMKLPDCLGQLGIFDVDYKYEVTDGKM